MQNRYDNKVEMFFDNVINYLHGLYISDDKIYVINAKEKNDNDTIGAKKALSRVRVMRKNWDLVRTGVKPNKIEPVGPLAFSNTPNDYGAFNAFINAYNIIMRYYEYDAKYNLKNTDLEKALTDWYVKTNQKPSFLSRFSNFIHKR